jgi:putative addiction module killer protein
MSTIEYTILIYQTERGKVPFSQWLEGIKDKKVKASIDLRVKRLSLGLFGDCKSCGNDIYELRIHLGAGYRVYYGLDGETVVVLLTGGDKSTQSKDIQKAKKYFSNYRSDDHES